VRATGDAPIGKRQKLLIEGSPETASLFPSGNRSGPTLFPLFVTRSSQEELQSQSALSSLSPTCRLIAVYGFSTVLLYGNWNAR